MMSVTEHGAGTRSPLARFTGGLFVVVGVLLLLPGAFLATLGGSLYYLLAGAALALSGILLWRGRRAGAWLFIGVCVATLAWSLWEAGLDGWALVPRLGIFVPLALLLLFAKWRGQVPSGARKPRSRIRAAPVVSGAAMLILAGIAFQLLDGRQAMSAGSWSPPPLADQEWPVTSGNVGSERFSRLDQITPSNVSRLRVAWKVHLGMTPAGKWGALQAAPLMVDDTLYMCNTFNEVRALDPETGRTLWSFDPKADISGSNSAICRGVAFYRQPGASGPCSARIIAFSIDARMFALDARTGRRCSGFGTNGEVDLTPGMGATERGYYYLTSAPTIVRGTIIIGGSVLDGQKIGEPSGVIRGFDAVTGKFRWAWDMARPDDHGMPPPGKTFTLATPNAWAPITGDEALGLAYVPLGNATPDYLAARRMPVMNKFASSVVALDVQTGALRWYFQTTHRDVWDYDVPSPPTLVDFPTPQGMRPALIQPTKRGQFFVLDRRTGAPLVKTVERRVPQGPVAGETVSPTQPYPVGMPSFGGDRLSEHDMWGLTVFDQLWCRIKFREARYEGDFTPIGLKPTIVYPGYLGGSEWAGVSVDPDRHLMALNVNHFAMYDQMIPRAEADRENIRPYKAGVVPVDVRAWAQTGLPYATRTGGFVSPLNVPCIKPPYGEIAVVDLATRRTVWRQPLGSARDSGPFGISSSLPITMGVPAIGGPLTTRSGLIFIAATQERTFRAFDIRSGQLLWQDRLPASGHAPPMTYYSKRSGRQFVVVAASGHFLMNSGNSDYLLAYALPR